MAIEDINIIDRRTITTVIEDLSYRIQDLDETIPYSEGGALLVISSEHPLNFGIPYADDIDEVY